MDGAKGNRATLLLTRPAPASRRFAVMAEQSLGAFARVVISPLQRIEPVAAEMTLAPGDSVALTSEPGARRAAELVAASGRRAWCVGPRTAAVAARLGFEALDGGGDVEALARAILAAPDVGGTIWHLSGRHVRGDLTARLLAAGRAAARCVVYDQVSEPLSERAVALLDQPGPVLAPVFSPRSAQLLAAEIGKNRADLRVAAISPRAALPLSELGLPVEIAPDPTAQGVIYALGRLIAAQSAA